MLHNSKQQSYLETFLLVQDRSRHPYGEILSSCETLERLFGSWRCHRWRCVEWLILEGGETTQRRHVWGRCLQTITIGSGSAGWVLDAVCVRRCGQGLFLWNFPSWDLAKETIPGIFSLWISECVCVCVCVCFFHTVFLCPRAHFLSKNTQNFLHRGKEGRNLPKLHLIVSLARNGKVVVRGSCFLMESCDWCRLGGFRGPSVWLLKCSTHDIMTVLSYGTADRMLKSRNQHRQKGQ